jgi:hypothetical protein
MKNIIKSSLIALLLIAGNAHAVLQDRWILVGDSIMSNVFEENSNIPALASNLTSHLIEQKANVVIHNFSSPGARMGDGGIKGVGAVNQIGAISHISGFFKAKGVIITLGTNDWGATSTSEYYLAYSKFVKHARSKGLLVACVSPIWRADQNSYKQVKGDNRWQLWTYRLVTQWACEHSGGKYIDGGQAPVQGLQFFGDKNNFGLHMNTYGHSVFSDWLVYKMRNLGYFK